MNPINAPYQIDLNRDQQRKIQSNSSKQIFPHRLSSGSACDTCRRRKTKCDGGSPCAYCANNNMQCIHRPSKRKKGILITSNRKIDGPYNTPWKTTKDNYNSSASCSSSSNNSSVSSSPATTLASASGSTIPLLFPSEYKLEGSDYHHDQQQSFSNPLKYTVSDRSYGMPSMMDQLSCYTFTVETAYGKRWCHY